MIIKWLADNSEPDNTEEENGVTEGAVVSTEGNDESEEYSGDIPTDLWRGGIKSSEEGEAVAEVIIEPEENPIKLPESGSDDDDDGSGAG